MRHRLVRVALTSALAAAFLAGCGGGGSKLVNPVTSSGSVTIEISKAQVPDFDWVTIDPATRKEFVTNSISVHSFDTNGRVVQTLWGYADATITPPVTYGTTLDGFNLGVGPARPLQRGVLYRVTISYRETDSVEGKESSADWLVP